MALRRWLPRLLLPLVALLLVDQVLLWAVRDGELSGRRIAPYDPPLFHSTQRELLERLRSAEEHTPLQGQLAFDAELGWCPLPDTQHAGDRYDWAGARVDDAPLAHAKPPGVRRIVTVGGSFTRGDEVAARDSWVAVLEREGEGLELANLAVGGFGVGQALLRWRRDGRPLEADEVWLGLVPGVSLRCVTTYWPAFGHWKNSLAFKPRFLPREDGEVELAPNPARSLAHTVELVSDQRAFLAAVGRNDAWVRAQPAAYAPAGTHWSHRSGLARVWLTYAEARGRETAPLLRDPQSELVRTLAGVARRFAAEVRAAGAVPRLVVLPDRDDLVQRASAGAGAWDELVESLRAEGLAVHDASEALVAAGALEEHELWRPGGHYGEELNGAVARWLLGSLAP